MTMLQPLQCSELERLRGYLDAARRCFARSQEETWLEAHLFAVSGGDLTYAEVLRAVFPQGTDGMPTVTIPFSVEDMVATASQLFRIFLYDTVDGRPRRGLDRIEQSLRAGLWAHIEAVIDYREAAIYAPLDAPYGATFTFIVRNDRQKRLFFFAGGSD
jgi:hypothetical protein